MIAKMLSKLVCSMLHENILSQRELPSRGDILDVMLVANAMSDEKVCSGCEGSISKIDFEKAIKNGVF